MANLNDLLQRLHAGQVEFVLVGGLAAVVYGVSLVTRDVDVCCRFSPENLSRLQNTLSDLNPVHRMTPQRLRLGLPPEAPGSLKNLYLSTDLGVLDCLSEVLGVGNYDEVLR